GHLILAVDCSRDRRRRRDTRTIRYCVAEFIGRGSTSLQADESAVRIVAEGAITIIGDLALGPVGGSIDRKVVTVADIRIAIGRGDRLRWSMFLHGGRDILRRWHIILAIDGDRDCRGRRRAGAIRYRVAELVGRGRAGL